MNTKIYLIGLIFISITLLFVYYNNKVIIDREKSEIDAMEKRYQEKKKLIESIRTESRECHEKDLTTPKDCYYKSNRKCIWNEKADRCDIKSTFF